MKKEPVKSILGIDPGTQYTGYGVVVLADDRIAYACAGEIKLHEKKSFLDKITHTKETLRTLLLGYENVNIAIEDAFYAENAQSMLKLGRMQGVIMGFSADYNIPFYTYAPTQIKKSVAGNGRASKHQIAEMLAYQLEKYPKTQAFSQDATDALAVALCHAFRLATS